MAKQRRSPLTLLRFGVWLAQVLIEPVREQFEVVDQVLPAVFGAFPDDQFGGNAQFFATVDKHLRLVNGDELVSVAVNDQRRSGIRADEVKRRDFLAQLLAVLRSLGSFFSEGRPEAF